MTKAEALKRFGLKESDTIVREGVLSLLKGAEEQLKVWSINKYDRVKIEKDIEAYKALLD